MHSMIWFCENISKTRKKYSTHQVGHHVCAEQRQQPLHKQLNPGMEKIVLKPKHHVILQEILRANFYYYNCCDAGIQTEKENQFIKIVRETKCAIFTSGIWQHDIKLTWLTSGLIYLCGEKM